MENGDAENGPTELWARNTTKGSNSVFLLVYGSCIAAKVLSSQRSEEIQKREAGAAQQRRDYTALDNKYLQEKGWKRCWSQDLRCTYHYRTSFRLQDRLSSESSGTYEQASRTAACQGSAQGVDPVYLSSSGATCSTKILGLGGVVRGKELEHLEGWEGGREEEHPSGREVVSEERDSEGCFQLHGTTSGKSSTETRFCEQTN